MNSPFYNKTEHDFVIAVDFGGTKIAMAIADTAGNILNQIRIDTNATQGAQQVLKRALTAMRELITQTVVNVGGQCTAVGVVTPGVIYDDRVLLSPNIPGWDQVALRETIRLGLGIENVAVENDVKAAALAEARWGALQDADPAVFLSLGTGIAAAIVVGGRVLTGAHGASGEIGYNLRGVQDASGAAQGRAPLEEAVGGRFLGEKGSRLLGEPLSAAELFTHSDVRARFLVDEALAELATHIANLAILIDPERIAVGGGLASSGNVILRALTFRLEYAVPFPPKIVPAKFLSEASLYGAIALALSGTTDGHLTTKEPLPYAVPHTTS
jgi:glucokinase